MKKSIFVAALIVSSCSFAAAGPNPESIDTHGEGWIKGKEKKSESEKKSTTVNPPQKNPAYIKSKKITESYIDSAAVQVLEGIYDVYSKTKSNSFFVLPISFNLK